MNWINFLIGSGIGLLILALIGACIGAATVDWEHNDRLVAPVFALATGGAIIAMIGLVIGFASL